MEARNRRGNQRGLPRQTAGSTARKGAPPSAGRSRTTAQGIIASLALPSALPASPTASPPPLISLHQLPRDASVLYDIGSVDIAGRITCNHIVDALHWEPGSRLDIILTSRTIVIRAAPSGLFSVPRRPRIIIPSNARHRHGISPGDHVLIAAAPDYGLMIVYPLSALDEMISRYHSAEGEAETPQ
jgi:bifunctional DNA-binding transcriptional regulator/antitoxin component of YhaV-PrlF toxin-antitoxin module